MPNHSSLQENAKWHYLLIALIACCIFWPISLGIFSLKNDAYIYFLPWRYHISETIQHGGFPFWSPYLYTGLPLYSDIQSGAWNPVVLFISLFGRYNMQILELELLFYIILAGIGMYKLICQMQYHSLTAITGSVAYMCCGFITDNGSFIPWITCAAYLPFTFLYFMRLLKNPAFENSGKLALSLFLLLTAGYPSFLIYSGYILFTACLYWAWLYRNEKNAILPRIKYLLITAGIFLLISAPALLSFYDFMPYYQRGRGATTEQIMTDPFSPFAAISYLIPSAGVKPHPWLTADITMRNASIGIYLLAFLLVTFRTRFTTFQKFITAAVLFTFIFSLGDATPLRQWCSDLLPFMNSFRHPSTMRLFTSIGLILLAGKSLDIFFTDRLLIKNKLKKILFILGTAISAILLYYLIKGFNLSGITTTTGNLKTYIDRLQFTDIAVIQAAIQLIFIIAFIFFQHRKKIAIGLLLGNSIVFAWMALPFTFVSQVKTKTVNQFINSFPEGFPDPDIHAPVDRINIPPYNPESINSFYFFYDKKIAIQETIITPTIPEAYFLYLSGRTLQDSLHPTPFVFFSSGNNKPDSDAVITLKEFSPTRFAFNITATHSGYLNLIQQYNQNWNAFVNEVPSTISKSHIAFMKTPVKTGTSLVEFRYQPGTAIRWSMAIGGIALFLLVLFIFLNTFIKRSNANQQKK